MTTRYMISLLIAITPLAAMAIPKIIPFKLVRNMMVVHASVNGQTGNFIFDSGVPGMVLNARYFQGNTNFASDCSGFQSIVGTSSDCKGDHVQMHLGELSIRGYAAVVDLKPMEQKKRMNILGMLGLQALKKYEIVLDYQMEEIRLYDLDGKGSRKDPEDYLLPDESLQFRSLEHIPYIAATVNGQELRLGIDTGAECNIFSEEFGNKLGVIDQQPKTMVTLGGIVRTVPSARVASVIVGQQQLPNLEALFMPLDQLKQLSGPKLHGLLGQEFLQYFRTAFNFKRKEIYLWKKDDLIRAARN